MENKITEYLDGRTITWLSEKTGIHRNSINQYIKGAEPRIGNAYKIAKVLNKSVYEIWPSTQ